MPLKIDELYAFIAEEPDGEGLAAHQLGAMMMPLIGADAARVDSLRALAQHVADQTGRPLRLCRFSVREELEEITPRARS